MIKIFKVAICIVVTLMAVGCELEYDADVKPLPDQPNEPGRPTVPLKKRPIVPTTKLPRPRITDKFNVAYDTETFEAMECGVTESPEEL
jgi:hypothetical protein